MSSSHEPPQVEFAKAYAWAQEHQPALEQMLSDAINNAIYAQPDDPVGFLVDELLRLAGREPIGASAAPAAAPPVAATPPTDDEPPAGATSRPPPPDTESWTTLAFLATGSFPSSCTSVTPQAATARTATHTQREETEVLIFVEIFGRALLPFLKSPD